MLLFRCTTSVVFLLLEKLCVRNALVLVIKEQSVSFKLGWTVMAAVDFQCCLRAHWARKMTTADMVSHRRNSLANKATKSTQPAAVAGQFVCTGFLHLGEAVEHAFSRVRGLRHRQRLEPRILKKDLWMRATCRFIFGNLPSLRSTTFNRYFSISCS